MSVNEGYRLKRPCKNCPFAPTRTRIVFSCQERAEEIAESAYRNGFPCHLSAVDTSEEDEDGGFVFGPKTQHCVGAIMMFLSDGNDCGWPGIYNDEDLAERLRDYVDWTAPHYETEQDFRRRQYEGSGMIGRSVPEWIGSSPDAAVPPRVRVRVFDRYEGRCQCGCNRKIMAGEAWECEDTIALINGGERRESNLKPWLKGHQKGKTARDVAEKSMVYRKRSRHLGIRKKSTFACSRDSRFKKKIGGQVVLR